MTQDKTTFLKVLNLPPTTLILGLGFEKSESSNNVGREGGGKQLWDHHCVIITP